MKCYKCNSEKELMKAGGGGTTTKICRTCQSASWRKRNSTEKGKKMNYALHRKSVAKNKIKQQARMRVHYIISKGGLCKPDKCELCFCKKNVFAHHTDYEKPLQVIWLCRECHINEHKEII